jgi:hypothetical protein
MHADGKRQPIEQRIEKRIEILRLWLLKGVPEGNRVPGSLKDVREWTDPELGIYPIPSPNEFTRTHHRHGSRVRDIASLLADLKRASKKPAGKVQRKLSRSSEKFDRKVLDRQLEATVSQWHTERDRRLKEERRADAAEARSILLLEENAKKDALIADLRRQIAGQKVLTVVK